MTPQPLWQPRNYAEAYHLYQWSLNKDLVQYAALHAHAANEAMYAAQGKDALHEAQIRAKAAREIHAALDNAAQTFLQFRDARQQSTEEIR